jgi:cytochrome b561
MTEQSPTRYSTLTQVLHWLTAIFVLVAFIYGPGGSEARVYAPSRDFERQLHETLGLCVLALVAVRLLWRLFDERPEPVAASRRLQMAAKAVQVGLYALLFAVPLTAIAGAWLEGHALTLLGGLQIAPPLAKQHAAGETIAQIHTWLGDTILWIAGLHAMAALYHQFVLKDGVLASMLPSRRAGRVV